MYICLVVHAKGVAQVAHSMADLADGLKKCIKQETF